MSHSNKQPGPIAFLFEYSGFLMAGALAAFLWANLDFTVPLGGGHEIRMNHESYSTFVGRDLIRLVSGKPPLEDAHGHEGDGHGSGHDGAEEHDAGHQGAEGHAEAVGDSLADSKEAIPHGAAGSASDQEREKAHGKEHEGQSTEKAEKHDEEAHAAHHHPFSFQFIVNDILMALFFAIAAKEVFESVLPGGPLSNFRKALTPLLATLGGILGPSLAYIGGAMLFDKSLVNGWAIPCATDIAFSYLIARLVFGNGHPAIAFLLLLAIADDAAGLVILATVYPQSPLEPIWFLLTLASIGLAVGLRQMRVQSFWWYLLGPGVLCWISFWQAGIHAALGLVPIVFFMPHAHTDLGLFAREELNRHDTLNEFEHWWKNPVEIILGLFGLANAGVVVSNVEVGTYLVLFGLLVGKPVGITLMTMFAQFGLGLQIPAGMSYRHIVTLGMVAAIGFTVALFMSTAAFPAGPLQDSVKMGALLSLGAAVIAPIMGRLLGIRPHVVHSDGDGHGSEKQEASGEVLQKSTPVTAETH